MLTAIVFWGSTLILGWVYAGYPASVAVLARVRPVKLRPTLDPPSLTVAIAVHDEADQVAERIADTFAQEQSGARILEVLIGSDGSTDATDSVVAALATPDPRIRLLRLDRRGQTETQNALFAAARGDVVVLTDAETRFEPGCLAALSTALQDGRVGCATGRLEWRGESATSTSEQEGLYWRYERRIRELESRAGLLTAVTGALLAVRRSAYRPVPAHASMDHLLPLYVRADCGLVIFVPTAIATDRPISGAREQFRNRTRTATRGIRANLSMAGRLAPWRQPGPALAIWSHKLLRWGTPWFVVAVGAAGLVLAARGATGYALGPVAIGAGLLMALIAHQLIGSGRRPPRLFAIARSFAVVTAAFAVGWVNVLRGRGIETWHRVEWRAES
ncbi:MAG: glycosyltransferase [Chloroflexi bacterium]|nr:MAG: glycosyltransferase [Chloroflexota bacterium]